VHALSKHKVSGHYTYHGSEHYTAPEWKAMDSLFRREYWERTWIIQEIQLAKNVLIHCGDGAFNWAAGGAFYDFLHSDRYLETDPGNITLKQSVIPSRAIQMSREPGQDLWIAGSSFRLQELRDPARIQERNLRSVS
jgi:hypothetical protein